MTTLKEAIASLVPTTLMGAELNSLANNGLVASSSKFTNYSADASNNGAPMVTLELYVPWGSAPAASTLVDGWFIRSIDGTNYESGSSTVTPARAPDFQFEQANSTNNQRISHDVPAPICQSFGILVRNNGTGQSFASSGNTLKAIFWTDTFA